LAREKADGRESRADDEDDYVVRAMWPLLGRRRRPPNVALPFFP
jgi:hypothetical protein